MPLPIKEAYLENISIVNQHAPYEVKAKNQQVVNDSLSRLAQMAGCHSEDLALVRNTTEAINAILYGIQWAPGDEIIVSNIDYPSALFTIEHLSARHGIHINTIDIDPSNDDPATILSKYEKAITSQTRLLLLTYVTHREGLVLPVKDICMMSRSKNVQTLVDGAHALGQIPHSISDLACDYYATSLHKWLYAPLGSGMLYVSKNLIPEIHPPNSFNPALAHKMDKFTNLGTLNFAKAMTLPAVIDFNEAIEIDRKYQRLKALQAYTIEGLNEIGHVNINSQPDHSCGIVSFNMQEKEYWGNKIAKELAKHGIHAKPTGYKGNSFVRITLNLHLDESDIDRLLSVIEEMAG